MGVVHKFVGPGNQLLYVELTSWFNFIIKVLRLHSSAEIKGFLTDVKPALLSALDTEYEKNPFEVYFNMVKVVLKKCFSFIEY